MHTDTLDHYYIWGVLMEYRASHNVKLAYNALRKRGIDFRNTVRFSPSVQKLLAEIYTLAHENSRAKKVAVETKEASAEESTKGEATEQEE